MEKLGIEHRTKIIEFYFENQQSFILTQRAYARHFKVREPPSQATIEQLVDRFQTQGAVVDLPRFGRRSDKKVKKTIQLVPNKFDQDPDVSSN